MHHVAGDAVFLVHRGDGLFRVVGRVALAAALGVGGERSLELISEAEGIHDQAAGLVREHAVHPGDGLHRLVGIHRVQAGRVETGQPHVAHDDDLERALRVLEADERRIRQGQFKLCEGCEYILCFPESESHPATMKAE